MSIGKALTEQLRRVANGSANGSLLHSADGKRLTVHNDMVQARLTFFDHDRYSVTLRTLEVGGGAAAGDDARAFLSAKAAAIVRRLSFLEEPLAVWELEGGERTAQLRSSPPQREETELFYWEVVLQAGSEPSATLARYRWAPEMTEREPVAYPATFALVARIADNLALALQEE